MYPAGSAARRRVEILERAAPRHVAVELVVRGGLVGDEVREDVAGEQPLEQVHGVGLGRRSRSARRASFAASARSIARSRLRLRSSR